MATLVDNQTDLSSDVSLLNDEVTVPEESTVVNEPETEPEQDLESSDEVPEESTEEEVEEEGKGKDLLPHERPSLAQIKEKFPEFFKTFPQLKDVIYREKEYSTLFPTIEDANQASETLTIFNDLEQDVTQGKGEKLLNSLKESDSLTKFATNFLPQLQKLDSNTYFAVTAPVLEHAIKAMYRQGKVQDSSDMVNAAHHIAKFIFGDAEFASSKALPEVIEKAEETEVKKERLQWEREKYQAFESDVQSGIRQGLTAEILKGFPKEGITTFVRSALINKIISEIDKNVASDNTHMAFSKRLWGKAQQAGFRSDLKDSIISAYLSRAKSLTPAIRRRLLVEALGITPSTEKKPIVNELTVQRREPGSSGRAPNVGGSTPSAKTVDWKRTSDLDLLNDKVTLKKGK